MHAEGDLPRGIVTFLFSDIEGSTRLIHEFGEEYVDLLEHHRAILRRAWATHDGHEISADGDGFFVAFQEAEQALEGAVEGQRALKRAGWRAGATVRVRMGIHTGPAWPHEDDYVALSVHQAARVMAAGHGGQILLSEDTAAALKSLRGLELRPLGRFRLRDFDDPPRLFQVVGAGLPVDFQAVRAVPADGHNIVRSQTTTIGREEVISTVAGEMGPGRLVTLVGPGGVGKSRIAAEVGIRIAPAWDDGVWRVELEGVTEADLVAGAIADAIGAPARPAGDRWTDTLDHLRPRRAVVILDNCEHLLAACRRLIEPMLSECEGVGVLVTSREPVRLPGEIIRPVEPLASPDSSGALDDVLASPAVRLFVERGTAVRPGFTLDGDNAQAIAAICRRLDGLPLFLELAAAHLAFQSPAEILAGLEDRFRLLRSRDPSLSERHQTVEGVLGWSYRLLEGDERIAFRRLSVFGSSFSLGTATAAMGGGDLAAEDVPQLIWSLVDRSLVAVDLTANDTRYRLLETVRSYGRRLLDERGEMDEIAVEVAGFFLERVGPWLPADLRWVGEVGVELGNLRGLVSLIPAGYEEVAQQLACSIGRYHDAAHSFREGVEELSRYVEGLVRPSSTRVGLLTTLADLHLRSGEVEAARGLVEAAEELVGEYGSPEWDDVGVDRARGEMARRTGDLEGAAEIARRALARPLSDRGRARMSNLLCTTQAAQGDYPAAYETCVEELRLNERVGYEGYIASAHGNLAEVAMRLGDVGTAAKHQRACLELAMAQGSVAMVAFSLVVAARVAGMRGEWREAGRLLGPAERLLSEIGLVLYDDDRHQVEELSAGGRRALGEAAFQQAVAEGSVLSMPDAAQLADTLLAGAQQAG